MELALVAANPDLALRSANNGFVLQSAALVLMMTPALAVFYGGFVRSLNPAGADGLIAGQGRQLWLQLQAAGFTVLWVAVGTYVVLQINRAWLPLRVSDTEERQGLDISVHGEEAYNTEFTG